tara:strand:- start:1888 stop:2142 length:255 start_codon:yes stop_codon:yes gene_type:complete
MIRPAKHLNLNACVLRAAALLISHLQAERVCKFAELRDAISILGEDAEPIFMPTVHFLYLMGRIEYHPQSDCFEYLNPRVENAQ